MPGRRPSRCSLSFAPGSDAFWRAARPRRCWGRSGSPRRTTGPGCWASTRWVWCMACEPSCRACWKLVCRRMWSTRHRRRDGRRWRGPGSIARPSMRSSRCRNASGTICALQRRRSVSRCSAPACWPRASPIHGATARRRGADRRTASRLFRTCAPRHGRFADHRHRCRPGHAAGHRQRQLLRATAQPHPGVGGAPNARHRRARSSYAVRMPPRLAGGGGPNDTEPQCLTMLPSPRISMA